MSDIRFRNSMNTNANTDNAHAGATTDSTLHANESGVSYDGSTTMDASHAATLPELPDAAADAQATLDAAAGDVTAHADAALGATGGLPELPDVNGALEGTLDASASATTDGATLGLEGMLAGFVDAMGTIMAQLSGGLSAMLGF